VNTFVRSYGKPRGGWLLGGEPSHSESKGAWASDFTRMARGTITDRPLKRRSVISSVPTHEGGPIDSNEISTNYAGMGRRMKLLQEYEQGSRRRIPARPWKNDQNGQWIYRGNLPGVLRMEPAGWFEEAKTGFGN